jgi:UDP-N-acetylmuramoylalanine-D-glutamate ligase
MRVCEGINQWDSEAPPRYVEKTHLSARVGQLNPQWNQDASEAATNAAFAKAVELTGAEFLESVDYFSKVRRRLRSGGTFIFHGT